jgi:uncharacterized protein YkwD
MIKVLQIIALAFIPSILFSQKNSFASENDFRYYKDLNDNEQRLSEFKDDDEALRVKLIQLDVINSSRKRYKADLVRLDILASRVANKMSKEAAGNNYLSHWNMAGEKPYHRYGFAGGYDHVSENAYGEWGGEDYDNSLSSISEMMKKGHASFMSERAPKDGHKKNIINKSHNYVGIGYAISGNNFRYYEEFIDRYFTFGSVPSELKINEKGFITLSTGGKNFPYFLIAFREKMPVPMKVAQLSRTGSYGDFSDEEALSIPAWDLSRYRKGDQYNIPVSFTKEGLYYIQICIDKKEITTPSALNTKGKIIASGIVIKVRRGE